MKKHLPVTDKENRRAPGDRPISTTGTKGIITDGNDAFVEISGFSREGRVEKSREIVCRPDMPAQAFTVMCRHLKAGQPWMGLVTNRWKNGDCYWRGACDSPIAEKGQIVGYDSVLFCPAGDEIHRAKRFYRAPH